MNKYLIKITFFIIIINSCNASILLSKNNPESLKEIIGDWYILSNDEFGKIDHKITFNTDGHVISKLKNIFKPGGPSDEYTGNTSLWEISSEDKYNGELIIKTINSNGSIVEKDTIIFNYSKIERNKFLNDNEKDKIEDFIKLSIYRPYLKYIKVCYIYGQGHWPAIYVKGEESLTEIINLHNALVDKENTRIDNLAKSLISNLKENDVYNIIYKDEYDLFLLSYFNNRENPNIENNIIYKFDEFKFEKDKIIFNKIKNIKYILNVFDMTTIPEYDFKTKGFIISQPFMKEHFLINNWVSFKIVNPLKLLIKPEQAEIFINKYKITEKEHAFNHGRNRDYNTDFKNINFYFTKPYKLIVLFKVLKNEKLNSIIGEIKQINLLPVRFIMVLDNDIYRN